MLAPRKRHAASLCAAVLAGLLTFASPASADPQFQDAFSFQQEAFGFAKPVGMAVAPDGRIFVTDDEGLVKTTMGGGSGSTTLFDLSNHVNDLQDRGLVGIAVDKNYLSNRRIFLLYTFEDNPAAPTASKTQRLVSVIVPNPIPAGPIVLDPEDETVILGSYSSSGSAPGVPFSSTQACPQPANLVSGTWPTAADETDCIPSDSAEHTVDSVRVDPDDGTLWVSVGDGGKGGSSVDTSAWRSQREESLNGKLLHIDTNGTGLPGHPFCPGETDLTKNCTKVHAKGFRNPFRFNFLSDGRPVVGDAGWENREEIDIAEPGLNYGWPCREGSINTPSWSARPECMALLPSVFTPPLYSYDQITDGAVIGGPVYGGKVGGGPGIEYPAEYKDAIFFNDYGNETVQYLRLDASGTAVAPGYPKLFAEQLMAVDWAPASNGDLLFVDIGFGSSGQTQIGRISYTPGDTPPKAVIGASKTFGLMSPPPNDFVVNFNSNGSIDADGGSLTYAWDLDGDGAFDDSSSPAPTFNYTDGTQNVDVKLQVTDDEANTATKTLTIYPGNLPPDPNITSGPLTYRNGQDLTFGGSATDPNNDGSSGDSSIPTGDLEWDVRLDHAGTHIHPFSGARDATTVRFETDTAHDAPSTYIVTFSAVDSRDMRATETRVLTPETAPVRIESVPAGAPISYAGLNRTAPYQQNSTIGLIATASAADTFTKDGRNYAFNGWADGGPLVRDLLVDSDGITITANYRDVTPAGPGPGPGPSPDNTAAKLSFSAKRGIDAKRGRIKGSATDPSGVARVEVALRAKKKVRGKCRWWSKRSRKLSTKATSCSKPAYIRASLKKKTGGVNWTASLGRRIPPGSYVLVFRTRDGEGNVGLKAPGGKSAVGFRVKR